MFNIDFCGNYYKLVKREPNEADRKKVEFMQVVENSQFFTSLEQMEAYVEQSGDTFDKDYFLIGLRNSIFMGYKLKLKKKK